MDSPQLTMESVEVSTTPGGGDQVEQDVEMVVPPRQQQEQQQYYGSPHPSALGKVDVDENDDTGDAAPSGQQHEQDMTVTTMSAPSSGFSLISAKSTDQVLDLENRLKCSGSSGVFRIHQQQQQQRRPDGSSSDAAPQPSQTSSDRRMLYSRTSSLRRSASRLARPSFSRRPSMHETYDSEPLMRGEFLYYLYSFAILGTGFRMFTGRFFGTDCEHPGHVSDFMSPLSENICVTSTGRTLQHGGALFSGEFWLQ